MTKTCTVYSKKKGKECGNSAIRTIISPTGLNQGAACNGHMAVISKSVRFWKEKSLWFGWTWERIEDE